MSVPKVLGGLLGLAAGAAVVVAALGGTVLREPVRVAPLTLVSWNVQGSVLPDAAIDGSSGSIVAHLRASGAEYVGLQEISAEHARAIARALGWGTDERHLRTAFEHGGASGGYAEGIAMISKYPITEYTAFEIRPADLAEHPDGRGRKLQFASITKDGTVFHLYNTHLASSDWSCRNCGAYVPGADDDEYRERQAAFVRDTVRRVDDASGRSDVVTVVGGDMNTDPASPGAPGLAYRTLASGLVDTWLQAHPDANTSGVCAPANGCTVSIRNGDKAPIRPSWRLDFFFLPPGRESLLGTVDTPGPDASGQFAALSDHFPYRITLGRDDAA